MDENLVLVSIQTAVIVIAGVLAIWRFKIWRLGIPMGKVTHRISHRSVSDDKIHVCIHVALHNTGRTLWVWRGSENTTHVYQIRPMVDDIEEPDFKWPLLKCRKGREDEEFKIEPGAIEEIYQEFLIPARVETILIESDYRDKNDPNRELVARTVYDIGAVT